MSIDMTLQKWAIFIMGVYGESFVGSSWNFVSGCIKNFDTHHESFSSKKRVIKKLSPKSLWQIYMKCALLERWVYVLCYVSCMSFFYLFIWISEYIHHTGGSFVSSCFLLLCDSVPSLCRGPQCRTTSLVQASWKVSSHKHWTAGG